MTYDLSSYTTPAEVMTEAGTLEFPLGVPTVESADAAYGVADRINAYQAYVNGYPAVSLWAAHKGFLAAGIEDGDVFLTSSLMDSRSLFLTANADTVYFWTFLDLSDGPMVMRAPERTLSIVDDMWWRWITDFGVPGPDRGHGGLYLFAGPDYDGPLPSGGYHVFRSRTNRISVIGRAFLENDDPAPAVARIKEQLSFARYAPGGIGFPVGTFLQGHTPLGQVEELATPRFVEGSGLAISTIIPVDTTFYEMLNEAIQAEPASALDPEIAAPIAGAGIRHGLDFAPDDRMRGILEEAAATANAVTRSVAFRPREAEGFSFYPGTGLHWTSPLFAGGYSFQTPPPLITANGLEPFPDRGAKLNLARASFFYLATGITPAMCMNLTGMGSQYIGATMDANGDGLDGGRHYTVTLPDGIPGAAFWSITLYDNQTRSMLVTDQRYPRAGSQSYPTPAAVPDPDGSITLHFSPSQPDGVVDGNWVQTAPGDGWFAILRFYSPTKAYFDKSWQPTDITPV
ncbi:DUF1254 domain-containing protein [Gordonia neofelifaecis]|uniref:DUF1254 domain-containing protein n=1 Tax=Gordonia neofelifaecis NRRL B-59395 TaxID=644548 RepID=F1YI04_9ACTN|nr:DUF1254 domain-containing protein [Gordonia neofelifaecis]EGD55558.1 hypothetical protein SCNU_07593 [Gordonia neofelifaecis NRRL B-59395]